MALLLIIRTLAVLGLALTCKATVYTVGDSAGWDISADLPSWAAGKNFLVGDVLSFQYTMYHSINEVDKRSYDSCNISNALQASSTGNTSIPLTTPGNKYFICGVLSHCLGGMKLQVSVNGGQAIAPATAPQSTQAPALSPPLPNPSTKSDNNPSPFVSTGSHHDPRKSMFLAWFCIIGALVYALG